MLIFRLIKFSTLALLISLLAVLIGSITHSRYELKADTEDKQLSEISKLRAENFKLKLQLTQCEITTERSILEGLFKKELNAQEADQFNWDSLSISSSDSKSK